MPGTITLYALGVWIVVGLCVGFGWGLDVARRKVDPMSRRLLITAWLITTVLTTQANQCGDEPSQCLERRATIDADFSVAETACGFRDASTYDEATCGTFQQKFYDDRDQAEALGCRIY